jgi:hypothetical protein
MFVNDVLPVSLASIHTCRDRSGELDVVRARGAPRRALHPPGVARENLGYAGGVLLVKNLRPIRP